MPLSLKLKAMCKLEEGEMNMLIHSKVLKYNY